ncbi:hypothetical protein [Nocardioides sp.]|uniref:hypothetical protein n=1 Tax=Nocardioides sp. TaxID=35761 RepID=UPI002F3F90B4
MNRTSVICTVAGVLAAGALVASTTGGIASASSGGRSHTLTFTTHQIASTGAAKDHHLLIETDRATRSGRTIGYTANTCSFDFAAHRAHCLVTLARPRGQMRVWATVDVDTGTILGKVTGGTGIYDGITGTVSGHPGSNPDASTFTIRWNG